MALTLNMVGGGGGSGKAVLAVTVTAGTATSVTATKGGESVSLAYSDGVWSAELPSFGTWTITAANSVSTQTDTVSAAQAGIYTATLRIPDVPSGYTQLEFIESTGTQYINTGVVCSQVERVTCTFKGASSSIDLAVTVGSLDNNDRWAPAVVYNSSNVDDRGASAIFSSTSISPWWAFSRINVLNQFVTLDANTKPNTTYSATCNGVTFTGGTIPSNSNHNVWLFAGNSSIWIGPLMIKGASLYGSGNTLVRNFIPARRNSDSVLGMYDNVNNVFYTNGGTGSFIAGPAI